MIGTYYATINATDEFNDIMLFQFIINVDYSLTARVQIILTQVDGILSALISLIATYKLYYFAYNFIFAKNNKMLDELVLCDKYFKRKYAFIKEEYDVAVDAHQKYLKSMKKIIKSNKKKITKASNIEKNTKNIDLAEKEIHTSIESNHIQTLISSISQFIPDEYKRKFSYLETIECILEGLIIIEFMKKTP